MLRNLTGWHALVILAIVLLVFGAAKLPALARSVGQSMRIFKNEIHDDKTQSDDSRPAVTGETVTATEAVQQPATAATVTTEPVHAEPAGLRA